MKRQRKKRGSRSSFLVADTGSEAFKQLDEEAADYTARELEAKMIAEQIKSFTDEKNGLYVWDKDRAELTEKPAIRIW